MPKDAVLVYRRLRRFTTMTACVLLLALFMSLGGCYGKFPLTRAVYRFNGEVTDSKIIHSVVFWVFVIIPVYGIASLGDAVIFNLVEFWTGNSLNVSSTSEANGKRVSLNTTPDGNAVLKVAGMPSAMGEVRFIRASATTFDVQNGSGQMIGHVIRGGNGDIMLTNAGGETMKVLSAADISQIRAGR